ncbi:ppx/GppA phosphatase family protein [Hirsutella rhossiliensis]|uniref:Ppx/GppA phosphatase family domain-containing protein n=1 Tax=Hirsutella rhossiliensis TaxID=111463 RepID=A0A9P8N3Z3_9HYPO|nr:ppx/GppA phosphatase family domain-containing protein [Hirsutella rhossiliensis]KAH0967213.1 ppx/GppA phosphatase family domain-containing protein [Hirsutella rhossiliensis]
MDPANLITLDNLSEQLPQWRPDDENHLHAVVDMGSNGIRFSISSLAPPKTRLLMPVYTTRAAISLYDALASSPSGHDFPQATIEAVSSTLARFRQLALMHRVPPANMAILATEAMRRAANAAQMLDAIAAATDGLRVQVLDPPVETLFGAVMGSRSGLVDVRGGALFLDLGGGSVQMTWVDTDGDLYEMDAAAAGESLPYGAARLMRILDEEPDEVQDKEIGKLHGGIRQIYANLGAKFPALQAINNAHERGDEGAVVNVYMCGGGFRGYGSMLMHNDAISPYPLSSTNGYSAPCRFFCQTAEMSRVNEEYDGKIFGLSKRRRRQFPAIVAVIDAFVAAVPNLGRVTFCGGSNRQGVLMMKLPLHIRESNPLDVLSPVSQAERKPFDAALHLLSAALPAGLASSGVPTIFSLGLGPLLVREIWDRAGHGADANSAFALHTSIVRDSESPGLTHLVRAVLGLSACARWACHLCPADARLFQGLRRVADSHHEDASFWAIYVGAVSSILASLFPVMPQDARHLLDTVRFDTHRVPGNKGKRDKIVLKIGVASACAEFVDTEGLADSFESTMSRKETRHTFKVIAQFAALS